TGLQLRYMGIIISTMLLVAFGVGWIIYHTSWSRIANTPDLTLDKLSDIFDSVNTILMRWIIVFILAIAILSIFVSHKIAGPVYRLEETAKFIASGDLTQQIQLRHGDELQDLQEAFNLMSDSLRKMVAKDREVIDKLVMTGSRLREKIDQKKLSPESIEEVTRELHVVIEELRLVTSGFKIEEGQNEETGDDDTEKDGQDTA
ncbi:MAG TPA: HAMP domain-containing protein, partial [Candidatus Rifleibacterium sp.]|nr:HAMP domain-containing protein [Candidatus Rifleibacterium sp.]